MTDGLVIEAFKKANVNRGLNKDGIFHSDRGSPYIQTFIFEKTMFMFGFLHKKTSASMSNSLDKLENELGHDLYRNHFSLILADKCS